MNVYMTEEEQVEQLKKWWNKYGNIILTLVLVIVLSVQGYRWYQGHQETLSATASSAFNGLMDSVAQNETDKATAKANFIKDNYQSTIYASSAALLLAKQAVAQKKYDVAEKEFKWIVANSQSKSFKQLAKLRLARLYLFQKQYPKALGALTEVDDNTFATLVHESKGDIYLAEGEKAKANEQYQQALAELPNPALASKELRLKLSQVSDQHSQTVNQAHTQPKKMA